MKYLIIIDNKNGKLKLLNYFYDDLISINNIATDCENLGLHYNIYKMEEIDKNGDLNCSNYCVHNNYDCYSFYDYKESNGRK
jgi:hypothetical protein